jgi:protein-S-isoprenylcysteine O-methyltransferase Ste14
LKSINIKGCAAGGEGLFSIVKTGHLSQNKRKGKGEGWEGKFFLNGSSIFSIVRSWVPKAAVVLSAIGVSLYLDRRCGFPPFVSQSVGRTGSFPFLIGGAWLWLWSVGKFLATKGTPVPVNPPPTLVTDGLYAYSRNPMMAGVFLMLAGLGIFFGSVWLTFITTPLAVIVSIIAFRTIEEPELEKRFGEAYRQYRKRTPILIPHIRRK